jgi:hypothetical protein
MQGRTSSRGGQRAARKIMKLEVGILEDRCKMKGIEKRPPFEKTKE